MLTSKQEMVPCGHCKARQLDCQYSRPAGTQAQGFPIGQSLAASTPSITDDKDGQVSVDRHLQELSLMHRWTVTTFDTIPTKFPDDYSIWQAEMPETALQHPFLLNALFAITTFELSGPAENAAEDYVQAGFKLKDRATLQIPLLSNATPSETSAALLYLNPLLLLLTVASIQYQPPGMTLANMLQTLTTDLITIQRVQEHLKAHSANLTGHPLQQPPVPPSEHPSQALDHSTTAAFRRLDELNMSRTGPPASAPFEVRFQATLHQSSCKKAIFWLEEAYTNLPLSTVNSDIRGQFTDHALGWIYLIDGEFISALREADEVACLLLLTWCLLVQTRGNRFWWARRFGTRMLAAISSTFGNTTTTAMREFFEWANGQALAV
jgi:hypothetical protein